jgi:electron transport complex protein RnfB
MKHTVFLADCTGCRLCLPVCPVDCITLVPVAAPADPESRAKKVHQLVETKQQRQAAGLARQLAAVEEHLEVPLPVAALPAAVQEKVDAARRQAQHKWQNKKAARPRHLVHKERGN